MPPCARALAPRGAFVTRRGDRAAARQRGAASWALVFDTAPHASARRLCILYTTPAAIFYMNYPGFETAFEFRKRNSFSFRV